MTSTSDSAEVATIAQTDALIRPLWSGPYTTTSPPLNAGLNANAAFVTLGFALWKWLAPLLKTSPISTTQDETESIPQEESEAYWAWLAELRAIAVEVSARAALSADKAAVLQIEAIREPHAF